MNSPDREKSHGLEAALSRSDASEDWWEQVLEACGVAASMMSAYFLLVDEQLRCMVANTTVAATEQAGEERSQEGHLGQAMQDILPNLYSGLAPLCRQVIDTGKPVVNVEVKAEAIEPSTERDSWIVSCFPVAATRPKVAVFMMETKRRKKRLEGALPTDDLRFRAMVQTSHDVITVETLRQQFERERLINKIAMRVLQSLELQDILDTAATEVRQFLQADRVVISRYNRKDSYIAVAESVGEGWSSCLGTPIKEPWLKESLSTDHQEAKAVIDDLLALPISGEVETWAKSLQIQARLAMPIALGDQLWGVLAVHQCSTVRHWESFEVELLGKLTTQLAIAIQQSELHEQIQQLNDDLENQVVSRTAELQVAFEFEATLKRITDRVRDSLDEDQILQAAVRELALVLKISGCNASLYDLELGTSTTCYEYTTSISPYQGRVAKFSASPELYNQLLRGQYFQFCSLVPNPERGLVAMLACPILDDQGVIGDLWLIHHKYYAFSEQDIRLAQQVANQCAIAIRQARLYKKSQAQVKELERLNQLKDDFLSTVSHELRTPLSNIKMAIHMLRTAPTPEKQERYMSILEAECSRETELINDLLDLQRLENESYSVVLEPIDLPSWLPSVLAPFMSRAQNRQQTIQVDLPTQMPELLSDRRCLERILAELLNNACKYTPPNGTIVLKVLYNPVSNVPSSSATAALPVATLPIATLPVTTLIVSNQADIPLAELPRMFEKFYRIPKTDPWQQGGTGLGLALVKKLVETLQGSISATSDEGWTTLKVDLPMPIGDVQA